MSYYVSILIYDINRKINCSLITFLQISEPEQLDFDFLQAFKSLRIEVSKEPQILISFLIYSKWKMLRRLKINFQSKMLLKTTKKSSHFVYEQFFYQ